jgi:enterochelin esterase family protein
VGLNLDIWGVEVRKYSGGFWSHWFWIYGSPHLVGSFFENPLDVSAFIGADSVQFRIFVLTQPDGAVVSPANVFLDDFILVAASGVDPIIGPQFGALFKRVAAAPEPARQAIADSFMAAISSFPFVEQRTIAYYLYRGTATTINVPGDANGWNTGAFPMTRIAGTNLWFRQAVFEPDARLDYQFFLNRSTAILDPLNPHQVNSGGGPNSELAMPDYVQPPEIEMYPNIPHGTLSNLTVSSRIPGNSRSIRVYTPPAYATAGSDSFPVVLFHDGFEYLNFGKANNVLDYLISENRIQPVIAVFVPPVQRSDEYAYNATSRFELFIVSEVMPFVDARYRTKRDPASRAMIGLSFGGLITTQICYNRPESFGLCGPYSPSYWAKGMEVFNHVVNGPKKDIKFYLDWGTYETGIAVNARPMRDKLLAMGHAVNWNEWHEAHSFGSWRAHIDNALEYFFPATAVSVQDRETIPLQFSLQQNYPNPFNPSTTIRYALAQGGHVSLKIFNLNGQEIATLVDGKQNAGEHLIHWHADSLPSGIYFYRLQAGEKLETRKMILMQ